RVVNPRDRAATWLSRSQFSLAGAVKGRGAGASAKGTARGASSLGSWRDLAVKRASLIPVRPVTLPPGRARRFTRPSRTGSSLPAIAIGMVVVARFAAALARDPLATMRLGPAEPAQRQAPAVGRDPRPRTGTPA